MISRRGLLAAPLLVTLPAAAAEGDTTERRFADLERRYGGRLGAAVLETGTMRVASYRGDERFPLCSTYKCLAAAFALARVDRGQESLARRVVYGRDALVAYSPVSEKHVGSEGMTIAELCEAAVTLSDNTAANLLLDSFGGPAALTGYLRSIGDQTTRLDRREPELNEANPADLRDTTSPLAMVDTLRRTVLGTALSAASRAQLAAWLVASKTGDKRLRAGIPKEWRAGDKTGSGAHNVTNDVAVIWPTGRAPVVVVAYYTDANASDAERNEVLSELGRLAVSI